LKITFPALWSRGTKKYHSLSPILLIGCSSSSHVPGTCPVREKLNNYSVFSFISFCYMPLIFIYIFFEFPKKTIYRWIHLFSNCSKISRNEGTREENKPEKGSARTTPIDTYLVCHAIVLIKLKGEWKWFKSRSTQNDMVFSWNLMVSRDKYEY
jgi:hypothetical protein